MSNPMKKFVKQITKSDIVRCQCVGESVYITDGHFAIKVPKFWYNELILTESPVFQPLNDGETATKDCNSKICKTVPNGMNIAAAMSGYVKKRKPLEISISHGSSARQENGASTVLYF